jgi:hypothetical protein
MSASVSYVNIYRSGGNGFNGQMGAVMVGAQTENLEGITIDHVNISDPAYRAIDIRPLPVPASHTVIATLSNVVFSNIEAVGAPACGNVNAYTGGSITLTGVCNCATVTSTPAVCAFTNASSSTLSILSNTCSAANCTSF